MVRTSVMVNGLPGKMATAAAELIANNDISYTELYPASLTGSNVPPSANIRGVEIALISPEARVKWEALRIYSQNPSIVVDFTHPSAVNDNAALYCRNNFPFVMGTTGGNREALEEVVKSSGISAVIAPNMAKQIVALQAAMERFADENLNLLDGCALSIIESHQKGKADTSGTAKAMVKYFNKLGIKFDARQIRMIREPEEQRKLGVPEEYLSAHGWHTYHITGADDKLRKLREVLSQFFDSNTFQNYMYSPPRGFSLRNPNEIFAHRRSLDETVEFSLRSESGIIRLDHNVNGRAIYAAGTLDALKFLRDRKDEKGRVYSMIDVLKAA